ncbi:MAG: alkylation response protein AidB-like acyl-CoA dehydrogenase [Bradymonadia bacterium]|jgi:alkylation response protein AidB-like acyl-CoA dehydrogenase
MTQMTALQAEALATDIARDEIAPAAGEWAAGHVFPTQVLRGFGARGLFGVNIDPAFGGLGAGAEGYVRVVRRLAAADAGTTVAMMVTNMVAEAIAAYGDDAQKDTVLRRIQSGDYAAGGFSLSEPGSGSDAASLTTTAIRDGDDGDYVLNGTKAWVTSGGHAGVYLVMARTDPNERSRGISAFLIDADTDGIQAAKPEEKMGLRSSTTTQLILESCRVPATRRLGPEGIGFRIAMSSLDGGRIGVSAQAIGIAMAAQEVAMAADVDHTPLMDSEAEIRAGWALCLRAARLKDAGKSFTRQAAMSKLFCSEMAYRVCRRALAALGPAGQTGPVARYARDTRVNRIYEGTSEVQRIVVAREILKSVA